MAAWLIGIGELLTLLFERLASMSFPNLDHTCEINQGGPGDLQLSDSAPDQLIPLDPIEPLPAGGSECRIHLMRDEESVSRRVATVNDLIEASRAFQIAAQVTESCKETPIEGFFR